MELSCQSARSSERLTLTLKGSASSRSLSIRSMGGYSSLADYAQELTEQTTEIPQHLQHYIDYERMARDMQMGGDVFTIEIAHDEVHIFFD